MDFFEEVLAPSFKEGVDPSTVKEGFEEYVSKRGEEFSSNLRKNRDEILAEKKTLAQQFKETQDKYAFLEGKDIDADSFNKMMSDLETYKSSATKDDEEFRQKLTHNYEAGKKAQADQLQPTLNSLKMKLEEATNARDTYQDKYKSYLKDSALRSAVSSIGADMDDWTFEGFKNSAKVDFDDDGGIKDISVKHDNGFIPIGDWKKIFPTTERGKKMIKAPLNTGMGGKGGASGAGGSMTMDEIEKIADPEVQKAKLMEFMAKNKK